MDFRRMIMLYSDSYKQCHPLMYPDNQEELVSYLTARKAMNENFPKMVVYGIQPFLMELADGFDNFFRETKEQVMYEYDHYIDAHLGIGNVARDRIMELHQLGYLPLEIRAVPEGMRTKVGVPQIEISNTHPDFVWLVNTIETLLSCSMWHTQVAAEVGYRYRKVVDKWVAQTCDASVDPRRMIGDFSMRGQHSAESAIKASGAWLLSHYNTATVPAIMWMEQHYDCDVTKEPVGFGAISTEHSVMCSNFAVDGDEITHIKRLLTEIYPNHSFSMVSDSYDYERLVTELLLQCKDEIMAHNGTLLIRGDSGNPVEVLAGKPIDWFTPYDEEEAEKLFVDKEFTREWLSDYARDCGIEEETVLYFHFMDKFYSVSVYPQWTRERGGWTDNNYYFIEEYAFEWEEIQPSLELLGTVWALDQIVGHTENEKGYKVLNSRLKAIYGDSILPDYANEAYKRLAAQGYAANNIVMGAGSMSMMALVCADENGQLQFAGKWNGTNAGPYTRDTFGIAVKATYAEDANGNPINIFKQPKALAWKKSQKGCCLVTLDGEYYTDEHTFEETCDWSKHNLLQPVFVNGEFVKRYTLAEVRKNLYPEG